MSLEIARKYESIVVFTPKLSEQEVDDEVAKITSFLTDRGASAVQVSSWGKRELAYEVQKQTRAHYMVIYFTLENLDALAELTYQYRITESIMKFQTHRVDQSGRATSPTSAEEGGSSRFN
jgi:small subunit ribosomal protein S6